MKDNTVKLSEQTKKILENYATINASIFIQATTGTATALRTCDNHKMVLAQTTIPETFTNDVCLYDLKAFLSVVTSFKDPDVIFNDNHVIVNDAGSSVKMVYADPSMVTIFNKDIPAITAVVSFDLKQDMLAKLLNFSNILSLPDLKLYTAGGKLLFQALDKKNPSTNTYEVEVGATDTTGEFYFQRDLFKMVPGDYKVEVSDKVAKFTSQLHDNLQYIVALGKK